VKPLVPHAREAGFEVLRRRGHYPINHTVVVRNHLLDADPDLARPVRRVRRGEADYVQRLGKAGSTCRPQPITSSCVSWRSPAIRCPTESSPTADARAMVQYSVERDPVPVGGD
jgi:hypothetical protein